MAKTLTHYGVAGMRWGVRKAASGLANSFRKSVVQKYGLTPGSHMQRSVKQKYGEKVSNYLSKPDATPKSKVKTVSVKKQRTAEEQKKHVADLKKKKAKQLIAEQEQRRAVKQTTNHLMTAYLTMNASKWAGEVAAPYSSSSPSSKNSELDAYNEWLRKG